LNANAPKGLSVKDLKKTLLLLLAAGLWSAATLAAAPELIVGDFSRGDLHDWKTKSFQGLTQYRLVTLDGRRVLEAVSEHAASGLVREMRVDLAQWPYLNWSWRVKNVLQGIDERTKAGDDYPARVYVVVSGGIAFWRTRTVVYVWSSRQPAGSMWPNAYTANACVMALRAGPGEGWAHERRDVRADFKKCFDDDIRAIDAVALMTDTDNSGQEATAWYGDIFFSRE
jgi:hypothetical protein